MLKSFLKTQDGHRWFEWIALWNNLSIFPNPVRADPSVLNASMTITSRFNWMPHLTQRSLVTTYHESEARDNRGLQCEMEALEVEENTTTTYWLSVRLTMWVTGRKRHVSLNLLQITQALELRSFLTRSATEDTWHALRKQWSLSLAPIAGICSRASLTSPLLILYRPASSAASSDFDNVELREHQVLCSPEYRGGQERETAEGWWGSQQATKVNETIPVHCKLTFCIG